MAGRIYPFPFRTRKSSAPAPMILPIGGKVGRRRLFLFSFCAPPLEGLFFALRAALVFPLLCLAGAHAEAAVFGFPGFMPLWGEKSSMRPSLLLLLRLALLLPAAFDGMACLGIPVRAGWRFLTSSPLSCSCAVPAGSLPVPAGLS